MKGVGAAVLLALVALASSGCGGGRQVKFANFSQVCGLSVPMPLGFHRRFWNSDGGGGVTISDGTREFGSPNQWPYDSNRVALAVHSPPAATLAGEFSDRYPSFGSRSH